MTRAKFDPYLNGGCMNARSLILDELDAAKQQQRIVTIFTNQNDSGDYAAGFVDLMSEKYVRLRCISRYGYSDGYRVREISSIIRLDWNSDFEKTMELMQSRQSKNPLDHTDLSKSLIDDDIMIGTLLDSKDKKLVVCVDSGINSDPIYGYIRDIQDGYLKILCIDDRIGKEDGFVTLSLDAIHNIDCDTQYERRLNILHDEYRQGDIVRIIR